MYVRSTPLPGPTPNAPSVARDVPAQILERLFQLKQSLALLEDYGFSILDDGDGEPPRSLSEEDEEDEGEEWDSEEYDEEEDMASLTEHGYSKKEAEVILAELENQRRDEEAQNKRRAQRMKAAQSKREGNGPAAGSVKNLEAVQKSKTKPSEKTTDKEEKPKASSSLTSSSKPFTFDLVEPEFGSSSSKHRSSSSISTSSTLQPTVSFNPYGEQTTLSHLDSQEKASTKRSLRFHTGKIESASRRREAARTMAMGGDDDVPLRGSVRTKRKEEEERRKVEEAKKRAQRGGEGDALDLDGGEDPEIEREEEVGSGKKGKKRARDEDGDEDGEKEKDAEGLYESVKMAKKKAKTEKKAAYEAEVAANK